MGEMLTSGFTRTVRLAGLLSGLALVAVRPAAAQTSYVVEDLGALAGDSDSVAWAINANGDVVGWSMGPAGSRAFLYTDASGMVALPGLPGRPRTVARDINDAGLIVGSANAGGVDLGHAVLWRGGAARDLGTLGTGSYSEAFGVNNVGQVAGWSYMNGGSLGVHGFLYSEAAGLVDLTPDSDTGYALDVNDEGQVTGYKTALGGYHAFRWEAGAFLDLGVLPGFAHSFGWAINASGQVTGGATSASGNTQRIFRSTDGGALQNLGGVGQANTAFGINGAGEVVGYGRPSAGLKRAFVFTDEAGLQDLNTLIDPSLGWFIHSANDVNDAGQIVGYASNNYTGRTHAVRLQPQTVPPPECTSHCLRSVRIVLNSQAVRKRYSIGGRVTVRDEDAAAIAGALVVATWTLPDGSSHDDNIFTNRNGQAFFNTEGGRGLYTLTIVNIERSLYTFNPSESVLSRKITVKGH